MGCGNSKSTAPPPREYRRETGVRRASSSSISSKDSSESADRRHRNRNNDNKLEHHRTSEKETNNEKIDINDGKTDSDKIGVIQLDNIEKDKAIDTTKEEENKTDEKETANEESTINNETGIDDANNDSIRNDREKENETTEKDTIGNEESTFNNEPGTEDNNIEATDGETTVNNDPGTEDTKLESTDDLNKDEVVVDKEKETEVNETEMTEKEDKDDKDNEEEKETINEFHAEDHTHNEETEKMDDKDEKEITPDATDNVDDGYDDVYTPFDDEDDENNVDIDGYTADSLGLMLKSIDYRSDPSDEVDELRPPVEPGELYTDKEFPLEIAIIQGNSGIEWKRPKEFMDNPTLFSSGTSRFDIGQGSAGTCWFLSTLSVIADKEEMINKIVPKNASNIEDPELYDGIFHARFYRFGKWEDIYIDDYVPVIYGNVLWGAKSSTDKNEIWVSLLEKAFARLHGSYDAIYGGQSGDAYLQLTGGIGERIDLDDYEKKKGSLFKRIKNALNSGCQVTCVVPSEYDDYLGLVGGHAYSLVGVKQINKTKLICVRNPWGRGEWKGPWSDGSNEWDGLSEKPPNKDDGEFYVSLTDFMKYFSMTTICSLTPDFDCDGISDSLNYLLNIYGQWTKEQSGSFTDLLRNPRFSFTITEKGMSDDGTVPFVVQIIQQSARRSVDHTSIRCDVFRIHADKMRKKGKVCVTEIQGMKNNVYTTELQSSFRHKLKPGKYMLIPSTCDGGIEKAFLLRLFTPAALKNIKQVPLETTILSCDYETSLNNNGEIQSLTFEKTLLGDFITGVNAGGQVSNRDSYATNPQYVITIPEMGADVPLVIHIMQKQVEPKYPVGFRLFPLDSGVIPPVDVNYLYDKYESSPNSLEGAQSKFMISWDVDLQYMLPPGRYIGLIHLDRPNTEKTFAVLFKSNCTIGIKGLQTGE